ncbi:hypothetical protein LIER_24859 [Lithospermum erythrorhizon]|uniref:Integrase catalytic domain-containing protein n=1 Tax=Lithospermum erythrorhizon TaxID=34254 RepID=A0AAV3R4W2_LITER
MQNRFCVPNDEKLGRQILEEAHRIVYTAHHGVCQQVKAEHKSPGGKLLSLPILRESGSILPWTSWWGYLELLLIYMKEIVRLHGVPASIVSEMNQDPHFVSHFSKRLHKALRTKLVFSTACHPQTDKQSERTIQTLEDMLRGYVLDLGGEKLVMAPDDLKDIEERISMIREWIQTSQSRQKSYAINHTEREATWELEEEIKDKYPQLFEEQAM